MIGYPINNSLTPFPEMPSSYKSIMGPMVCAVLRLNYNIINSPYYRSRGYMPTCATYSKLCKKNLYFI